MQPNTTMTVETTAGFVGGEITYTREVQIAPDGRFSIRLPYLGTYSVGNRTVVVSEEAVYNSTVITVKDENSE